MARGYLTQRYCGSITDGIASDVGDVREAVMWDEWPDKLDRWCVSHGEESLIMLNEPL